MVNDEASDGTSIDDAVNRSKFSSTTGVYPEVVNLSILSGSVSRNDFMSMCDRYPNLDTFIGTSEVEYKGEVIPSSAFRACGKLRHVEIRNVVTLEDSVFLEAMNLTTVSLPEVGYAGSVVFWHCTKLVDVNLPNLMFGGNEIFLGCTSLVKISLPKCLELKTGAFSSCTALEEVDLSSITVLHPEVFATCGNLENLSFPAATHVDSGAFRASSVKRLVLDSVTSCGLYAMCDLYELREVSITNLTKIPKGCFMFCLNLTTVEMPNVVEIAMWGFQTCIRLEFSEMPNLTHIEESAFEGCTRVSELSTSILPNLTSIGVTAFQDCRSLQRVSLWSVETISRMSFAKCVNLWAVYLPNLIRAGEGAFRYCTAIVELTTAIENVPEYLFSEMEIITKFRESATKTIGKYAFFRCFNLQKVECESVVQICEHAFDSCTELKEISFPVVVSIETSAFQDCTQILALIVSPEETESKALTIMDRAFLRCFALEQVLCPSAVNIGIAAFERAGVKFLTISRVQRISEYAFMQTPIQRAQFASVRYVGKGAFIACTQLRILACPNMTDVPDSMCLACENLVEFHGQMVKSIGEQAFYKCGNLETFDSGSELTVLRQGCFTLCRSFRELQFPELVIFEGDCHFLGCTNLTYISMPKLVTVPESSRWIFGGCVSLKRIDMPDTPPKTFNKRVFVSTGVEMENYVIPITLCLRSSQFYESYGAEDWLYLSTKVPADYLETCANYSSVPLPDRKRMVTWTIVGLAAGAVLVIIAIAVVVDFIVRRRYRERIEKQLYLTARVVDDFG